MNRRPFWSWWAGVLTRRPGLVMLGTGAAMVLGLAVVSGAPKDLSFTGIIDADEPEFLRYRAAIEEFGDQLSLVALLEGEPDDLALVGARFQEELPARTMVESVVLPGDPDWILERAPLLWPDTLFQTALQLAVLPAERANELYGLSGIPLADQAMIERVQPIDRAMVVTMSLEGDPFDMAVGGIYFTTVQKETSRIVAELDVPVEVSFTGMAAIGAQDQNSVLFRVVWLLPLTFLAVLLLLRGVERRLMRLIIAGIALGGSVAIAFGIIVIIQGRLNIMSTFFGLLLLGLGVDFAIHLLVALRDSRAGGSTPDEAIAEALDKVGPPIVAGGLTSAFATGVVIFVPEPGSRDMGLTATIGLSVALALMLSFVPAAWLILERRYVKKDEPPRAFRLPGLAALVGLATRYPRITVGAFVVLVGASLAGLPRYTIETDLERIFTRDVPALVVQERIETLYNSAPTAYLATVDSLDQAQAWSERLRQEPDIGDVFSAADWIRPDQDERRAAMETALRLAEGTDHPVRQRLRRAIDHGPLTLDSIPDSFRIGTIGKSGTLAVRIVPREASLDSVVINEQATRLRAIAPTLSGAQVVASRLITGQRDWIPLLCTFILSIVVIVLLASFRKPRHVLLAILPVVAATTMSIGALCWFGVRVNTLTSIVVPIVLGLGIDDGIHLVERLRRYPTWDETSLREAVEGVGRAIFLTTATTTAAFVGLLASNHPGLEGVALFMLIGVPTCFLASVTLIPAAASLFKRR